MLAITQQPLLIASLISLCFPALDQFPFLACLEQEHEFEGYDFEGKMPCNCEVISMCMIIHMAKEYWVGKWERIWVPSPLYQTGSAYLWASEYM